jgi:Ca-activated chloride channel family protein
MIGAVVTALLGVVLGCDAGGLGATPGGVQDMRLARESIENGRVPAPEAFVVEGMFSEHDLPLAGPTCNKPLCLRAAAGIAPDLDATPKGWVQIGMSSTISADNYERPPTSYVAVVDVSGSMGWAYGESGTPGELSRALLHAVSDELTAGDEIAVVTYGSSVRDALPFTRGDDQTAIDAVIEDLSSDGSTNMEAGLERAYALAREASGTDRTQILLFTDVQPNVGATSGSEFEQMAAEAATRGTGTTVFAMGLGVGQELLIAMSHLEGGNAYGILEDADIERVMDESFDFLADPIASDLEVSLEITSDGDLAGRDFGFPAADDSDEIGLEVKSVFLSRRRGALLLEVDGDLSDGFALTGTIAYEDRAGDAVTETLEVALDGLGLDDRGHSFEQPGVAKTTALALLVSGMREAAEQYRESPDVAAARMEIVLARAEADADALDDEGLRTEAALAASLLELMQGGASQDSFYGGF